MESSSNQKEEHVVHEIDRMIGNCANQLMD
jgi:hypothetical protein